MNPLQCYITGTWLNPTKSKTTEKQCWCHYFSLLMTIIYNHQNHFKKVWIGWSIWKFAKIQPNRDSSCFVRLLRLMWQIWRRHHLATQYQEVFLSSLWFLKINLKPSTYTRIAAMKNRTLNHPSPYWIKPLHVLDMTSTLISSAMLSKMHSKKNCWCCLRVIASLIIGNSTKICFVFWWK